MQQGLRVLFIEDSEDDLLLLLRALRRGGFELHYERVNSAATLTAALDRQPWDLILADHSMPGFSAPEALALVKARELDLPFLIVSGHIGEEVAVKAMQDGADDYLFKHNLARLLPAVDRGLRQAEDRRQRRLLEKQLRWMTGELEMLVGKRTRELTAADVELQNAIQERKRLEDELLAIAEQIRTRVAFDLHDTLGQQLTALSFMAASLCQALVEKHLPLAENARRMQDVLQQIMTSAHDLAVHFCSMDLAEANLEQSLKQLAGEVKRLFGITCRVRVEGALGCCDQKVVHHLTKLVQEAVSNAIKHGHAKAVSIRLSCQPDKLMLTVQTDGLPFPDMPPRTMGLGLRIMNYRAHLVGAALEIRSNGKHGTRVSCSLPGAIAFATSPNAAMANGK